MNQALTNTAQLQQIIDQEIVVMQSLTQLLDEEQQVLVNNDSEKLESITPNKNQLLAQVIELEKNRSELLLNSGHSSDAKGMLNFFTANTGNHSLKLENSWQSLLDISSQAQEKNRTNGLLINRHLSKNQAALNVLQSGGGHQAGSMYGADGQSKVKPSAGRGIVAG
ncbi:flagella synthesis protein FlgN [Undibacterium flavidum]|uniref:Flagellar protein FlgN n=1 Tax=Undibacterium flavidum TaxID=2762297 RepID=A0ABR6YEJ8_9BURK|nr:flagellar protein FlgN [Undibacterium flavidum]MBC3874995.1 flagellar protein FlgN [Undibacterium flavidum]